MFTHFEDFETLAFVVLALVFQALERRRPARQIDKMADLKLDILAVVVLSVSLAIYRKSIGAFFQEHAQAFLHAIPASSLAFLAYLRQLPSFPKIILAFVATDFCLYWAHRLMHSADPLWKTHVWHHTSEHLYWLSGARTSLVHGFIYTIPQVFFPFYVFKFSLAEAAVAFPIGVLVQFWEHSNLDYDLGPINWLFVNPVYHRVHHSIDRHYHDSNYGTLLTIWDRIFGTYTDPKTLPENFKLGVSEKVSMGARAIRMVVGV